METIKTAVMDIGEPRQLVLPCPYCGDNKVVMARQVKKEEVESNPIFAEFLDYSVNGGSPPMRPRCSWLVLSSVSFNIILTQIIAAGLPKSESIWFK